MSTAHSTRDDDDPALALLRLLAQEDGQSIHRVAKRLGLGLSELQRLLVALGCDTRFDGLGLVEQRPDGERTLLWLTDKGRQLCGTA
jgi:DNA-binding IclR family transcriptional regulator